MKTIFNDPVRHPDQPVRAFVGAFASDFLGDYATPLDAVQAARESGYGTVHVMYGDGTADAIDSHDDLPTTTEPTLLQVKIQWSEAVSYETTIEIEGEQFDAWMATQDDRTSATVLDYLRETEDLDWFEYTDSTTDFRAVNDRSLDDAAVVES